MPVFEDMSAYADMSASAPPSGRWHVGLLADISAGHSATCVRHVLPTKKNASSRRHVFTRHSQLSCTPPWLWRSRKEDPSSSSSFSCDDDRGRRMWSRTLLSAGGSSSSLLSSASLIAAVDEGGSSFSSFHLPRCLRKTPSRPSLSLTRRRDNRGNGKGRQEGLGANYHDGASTRGMWPNCKTLILTRNRPRLFVPDWLS